MPRTSKRKRALRILQRCVRSRRSGASSRYLFDDCDNFEDDIDEQIELQLEDVSWSRYSFRNKTYRKRSDKWKAYLDDHGELNDEDFLGHFRVSRSAFSALLKLIRDDTVFKSSGLRGFRGGAELHLLILLKYLGGFGNESTSLKLEHFFGVGKGSIKNYVKRACPAILKLKSDTIVWPNSDERELIAARIQEKFNFVNCVGLVDGTLLPFEFKPRRNGEGYFSRKGGYSLNALIICADIARIREAVVGWPGSVHDNRVWTTSRICRAPEAFFYHKQYLLGDSAFHPSSVMIPAFKKPPKSDMDPHRKYFNTQLAKAHIKTEHCIGLVKTRLQYLRGIRLKLSGKKSMKRLLRLITCAFILHSLLIFEPIPKKWKKAVKLNGNGLDVDDELNQPIGRNAQGNERRTQLFHYLHEVRNK